MQRKHRPGSRGADERLLVSASPEELRRALDALSPELPWAELRDALRPVFVRRRPLPPGIERPVTLITPLGLQVALGADIGPAVMYVSPGMLETWSISADAAFDQAMANLRAAMAAERDAELEYGTIGDVPTWWYQSRGGLASGLLLIEDELHRRYGAEPRLLVAPMRNLLIAAPFDADRALMSWIRDDIAFEDPNGLDLPLFALVDGRLSIEGGGGVGRGVPVH